MITASEFLIWCEIFNVTRGGNPPTDVTLQIAYNNSSSPQIVMTALDGLLLQNSFGQNQFFWNDTGTVSYFPFNVSTASYTSSFQSNNELHNALSGSSVPVDSPTYQTSYNAVNSSNVLPGSSFFTEKFGYHNLTAGQESGFYTGTLKSAGSQINAFGFIGVLNSVNPFNNQSIGFLNTDQVLIGNSTAQNYVSSLDVFSLTGTRGSRPIPGLTSAQITSIDKSTTYQTFPVGLMAYNTDYDILQYLSSNTDFQTILTKELLIEGSNISIDKSNPNGQVIISASGGGTNVDLAQCQIVVTGNTTSIPFSTSAFVPISVDPTKFLSPIRQIGMTGLLVTIPAGITNVPAMQSNSTGTRWYDVSFVISVKSNATTFNTYSFTLGILKAGGSTVLTGVYPATTYYASSNVGGVVTIKGLVPLATGDSVFAYIADQSTFASVIITDLVATAIDTSTNGISGTTNDIAIFASGGGLQDSGVLISNIVQNDGNTYNINISGNAATANSAGLAADISTSVTSVNSNFFIPLLTNSSGSQPVLTCAPLIFNPSTGIMSLTGLKVTGLSPLEAVVSDGVGNLTSLVYTNANTVSTLVQRDSSGNFSAGTITATLSGTSTNSNNVATTQATTNASYFPLFVASSVNGFQAVDLSTGFTFNPSNNTMSMFGLNLSGLTASSPVFTDSGKNLTSSGTVPFANGGFGFSTATTGDIFYASGTNTPGKLSDVATGSVLISGGVGSAPSYSASPTLTGLTLSSAVNLILTANSSNVLTITSTTGVANRADIVLNRNDQTNGNNRVIYQTATGAAWSVGSRGGAADYVIRDDVNNVAQLTMTQGSGTSGTSLFAGLVQVNGAFNAQSTVNANLSTSAALQFGANGGGISAKNSSGGVEVFCFPRFTDNKTYFDIGSAGLTMRQNAAGTTWMTVDTSGNVNFTQGNPLVTTASKTLGLKSGANGSTGSFTFSSGSATISTTAAHAGDLLDFMITTASNPGFITVSINAGVGYTLTSSSATDGSTLSWKRTSVS